MHGYVFKKIIVLSIVFFTVPLFAIRAEQINLSISPVTPEAGQTVTATLQSLDVDLNTSEITWFVNNAVSKKGVGLRTFVFTLGSEQTTLKSSIKSGTKTSTLSLSVNPSNMDVLWEVLGGYEPPFYKGKVLPVKGSQVKVVAVPQTVTTSGSFQDPKTFVYGWSKDGSNFAGQSGYGRDSFSYVGNVLDRDNTIEVSASTGGKEVRRSVTITPFSSEIHFYEYSLAYGPLYNRALKNGHIVKGERFNVLAEPFFIFTNDISDPLLATEWKVNNIVSKPDQKNLVFLNIASNISAVDLSFMTNNTNQLLQKTSRPLRLNIVKQ